jgi:hypothetical protein
VIVGEQPEVIISKAGFSRIEGLIQVVVTMGAADFGVCPKIAPHVQRNPSFTE